MTVAYLVNHYPYPSHSFIRREIAALEDLGLIVHRFTIRRWAGTLVDPLDARELPRTRGILDAGVWGLLRSTARAAVRTPLRLAQAARLAISVGRRSERGIVKHLAYLAEACVLRDWLEPTGATHVHAHFGTNPAAVAMLCRVLGGPPYSFTTHGPEEFDSPRSLSLGEKVDRSAFTVAISEYGRSQLYRWSSPGAWPKIRVVRCGVDAQFLEVTPTPPPGDRRIVCVGRLAEQKGQLVLIEAARCLRDDGKDFRLVLVGDGPMRGEIESKIAEYDLSRQVTLLGWQGGEAIRREILAARALVLPSFAEGLPVVLMEALALGRPVISTYVAGIPELVEPGRNGWLVPAGSVEALARAMGVALDAPLEDLERMGRAGAARVAECHDAARSARALAGYYTSRVPGSEVESAPVVGPIRASRTALCDMKEAL